MNMTMRKVAIFAIFALSPLLTIAQAKPLTSEEFFPLIHKANDATRAVPHRSVSTNRRFVDSVPSVAWIQTIEALNRETSRLVQKKDSDIIELISIGRKNFQRENGGKWREVGTPENVYLFRVIGGPHTSEYYSEIATINGRRYTVLTWYVNELAGRFSESKTYIATDGKIFRKESSGGTLDPRAILWDEVIEYVYDIGPLKIEAPIP